MKDEKNSNSEIVGRSMRRGTRKTLTALTAGLLNDVEEGEQDEKANESLFEGRKLIFDALKHLTTLSTGSIVLMTTFIDKLFKQPEWNIFIGASYIGFSLTVILSVYAMFLIGIQRIGRYDPQARFGKTEMIVGSGSIILAFAFFALSVLFLSLFAMKNFY